MTYHVHLPWLAQGAVHPSQVIDGGRVVNVARLYMPTVINADPPAQGQADLCGMTQVEYELYSLIVDDPRQERGDLVCDERLVRAAQDKAKAVAQQGRISHTVDGVSANRNVENHGYRLPKWYGQGPDANNVESLAAGYFTPATVLEGWRGSESHRKHIFGEGDFYAGQSRIGVGHVYHVAPNGLAHWWVVLTAHKE